MTLVSQFDIPFCLILIIYQFQTFYMNYWHLIL